MDAIRLLLIEDSEDDAILVVNRLRRSGVDVTYRRVETAEAMSVELHGGSPDVVISDNGMPTFSAQAALGLLKDSGLDVPFIVVSGQIGEEAAAALMRAGAHDFVLKDSLTRLGPAVHRELREARERQERRRAQAALDVTEERFRLVAEHIRDVVFRYRLGARPALEYISPAVAEVTGHRPEELYADAGLIFDAVEPEDRAAVRRSWQSPSAQPLVARWRRPDGSTRWIEQRLAAVVAHDGRPMAVEGMLRDVTDQVRANREREELERQLHQAERLDSLGQLAGGIAHDFNNLLNVICSYAGFVLEELGPDHPSRSDVDSIDNAARQAAALTRQLLIFSRLQPARPEIVDLNAVVVDIERLLRRTIGEDIEFVIRAAPDLDRVTIDRSRLEQIVMNLVVNARAAMPDGGRLTIETGIGGRDGETGPGADAPGGRFVSLAVADTGCGMDPDTKRRAFEPFFTTKGHGRGSGLGLATVYGAVHEAGGSITLWSEPGRGTRVTVLLPSAGQREPDPSRSGAGGAGSPGGGERVLVVEDDPAVREVTRRILTSRGYRVTDAASRDEALRVITDDRHGFEVLLSDVVMPGMPAPEFVEAVRALRPTLPIVFMSGYTADARSGGKRLPGDIPVVAKPFDAVTLLHEIRAALSR